MSGSNELYGVALNSCLIFAAGSALLAYLAFTMNFRAGRVLGLLLGKTAQRGGKPIKPAVKSELVDVQKLKQIFKKYQIILQASPRTHHLERRLQQLLENCGVRFCSGQAIAINGIIGLKTQVVQFSEQRQEKCLLILDVCFNAVSEEVHQQFETTETEAQDAMLWRVIEFLANYLEFSVCQQQQTAGLA